jgi:cytochrome c oxidase cbb3-type subunit 3
MDRIRADKGWPLGHELRLGRKPELGLLRILVLLAGMTLVTAAIPAAQDRTNSAEDRAAAERGQKTFTQSCAFCHGADATGARGPDLVRSPLVAHDAKGDLIGPVIRQGRPDKGMPPLPLTDEQISDVAAFLHSKTAEAMATSSVPHDYAVEKLLTGNADAGKAYFNGTGGCTKCHSVTGDLANVAGKYSSIELEAHMIYPEKRESKVATVTLPTGEKITGPVEHIDDFTIGVRDSSGWYRSFPRASVKVEVQDRLAAHRELLDKLTQTDFHNLYAYIATLKKP